MTQFDAPAVTWEKAKPVLEALVNAKSIREVLVVGSVAREGQGKDLDVVLVVDTYTYITFLKAMWDEYDRTGGYYSDYCHERQQAALAAIQFAPAEYGWLLLAMRTLKARIDFHLMPVDWLQNMDAVQSHLPHDDSEFVHKIAGDARYVHGTQVGARYKLVTSYWNQCKKVIG